MKQQRTLFQQEVAELAVDLFKFLDESSITLSLTWLYGRAAPDQRVVDSAPHPSGPPTTTLAVISLTGITAPLVRSGAVNDPVFYGYLKQCVVPTLHPGDIIYLPPYSPDFNPIELAWSKVKTILRRLKARTFPELIAALKEALQDERIPRATAHIFVILPSRMTRFERSPRAAVCQ